VGNETPRNIIIREVVRGERNWRDLQKHSIGVDVAADAVREISVAEAPVKVFAHDVAHGWLRYAADERALREWARFVHGAVGIVALELDDHPLGDALLDMLWRATFNEPITPDMERTVRRVLVTPAD
jgi:hypothetical protein